MHPGTGGVHHPPPAAPPSLPSRWIACSLGLAGSILVAADGMASGASESVHGPLASEAAPENVSRNELGAVHGGRQYMVVGWAEHEMGSSGSGIIEE